MIGLNTKRLFPALAALLALTVTTANASPAIQTLLQEYQAAGAGPFSAAAGQQLWTQKVDDNSCSSCHSASAREGGKHIRTGKLIKPMAPSANPASLTDRAKIEKWFLRNCRSTFGRECAAQEKGDLLSWLAQQ